MVQFLQKSTTLLVVTTLCLGAARAGDEPAPKRLLDGRRVKLDFKDRPVVEVLKDLAERSGVRIVGPQGGMATRGFVAKKAFDIPLPAPAPLPDPAPDAPANAFVTVQAPEPAPILEAVDRVAEAAGLHYTVENVGGGSSGGDAQIRVYEIVWPLPPATFQGPFRVAVEGIHDYRERVTIRGPWARLMGMLVPADGSALSEIPAQAGPFHVALALMVEPGLSCRVTGDVEVEEAVDEKGRSLAAPPIPPARGTPSLMSGGGLSVYVPLRPPADGPPPARLARLRGKIPAEVFRVQTKPAVTIPMTAEQVGKTFEAAGAELKVEKVDQPDPKTLHVMITGRILGDASPEVKAARADEITQRLVRYVDARGEPFPDPSHGSSNNRMGGFSFDFHRYPQQTSAAGGSIQIFETDREAEAVRFDFRDLPLPNLEAGR